ncbi:MAG: tetratricopeptide repeat protein, partial [Planctomycetaceae bacterium]
TARWLHADILNLMGQTEASEKLIGESQSDRGTGSSLAQFLRARNAFSRRNWPLAATLSRQVFDDRYTGPFVRTIAGLNLAACYREMGQSNRERQACLDVLSINPGSSEAVFELASSNLRLGNLAEALPQFRAIENRPEAAAAVAHILIEQNRVRPESEQRWDEAEVAIESAAQTLPNPADAVLLRSRYLFARRKPEEAVSVLKRALKTNAGDVRLWLQLFEADAFRQDWDAALATLDQADAVLQRPQATLAARIALAAARQDRETLAKLTQTVQSLGSADEEVADRANLYRQLAIAWQGLRDVEQAQACWEIVKQERPYDVTVREALLVLALLKADEAGARRLVEEIKDIEGADGVRWRMADAERLFILVERGERKYLREVDQILRQLDEQMPASAVLSTRRGDVARLQGDVEAALQHYQSAVDLGSPSQDCVFQMANLLYQRGQFADVSRLIRQFEQSARRTLAPPLAQLGAIASLQENALLEAVRFAQIGADPDSARFEDQIALGRFQQIAGQFEQAEASFRRAIELAPGQPEAWVSLVSFLMATDRRPEADAVMTQAQSAVSPGLIHITLAQCFDVLDDVEQAAVHYGRVASEFSGDPLQLGAAIRFFMRSGRKDAAIDVLRPIAADVQQASPAAAVVARRLLGAILAESAEYQDRLEALELFNRNLAVPDRIDGREDALLKARLLAASRLRRDQLAARELLEQLRSEGLLPVHDAKQLVELYRISGDSRTAIELTVSLVARTQRNPEILAWATDLLLSLGMSDSHQEFVEQWLELQDSLRPGDLNTQVLRARWFIARGRPDDALSLLQSIPLDQSGDAPSNESANRRLQLAFATDRIAQEFDRNGQLAESEDFARFAEDLYRNAPENPETSLLLVRFLMRRWRVDEAVEICRELRGKLPDERVAGVCVSLLQTRHVGTEQSAEIRGWLGDRHEAQPDSPVLALLCAHAASLDGNYRAAIALHRRVVELQPTNFESLNELALLLTLQAGPSSEAMQLIESAIEQAGPLGVLLDTRATVALANRQPELAERSALDAVAEAPAAEFYFHLAQTQLALDKRDAAKDSLRMAFKRGLHVNSVHPLERPALERLQLELGP